MRFDILFFYFSTVHCVLKLLKAQMFIFTDQAVNSFWQLEDLTPPTSRYESF